MESVESEISIDDVFDALADLERRRVLVGLLDGPATTAVPDRDAAENSVSMHHVHLPKLDDYGLIEWDRETDEVTRGRNFDEVRPFLELLDQHTDELPPGLV